MSIVSASFPAAHIPVLKIKSPAGYVSLEVVQNVILNLKQKPKNSTKKAYWQKRGRGENGGISRGRASRNAGHMAYDILKVIGTRHRRHDCLTVVAPGDIPAHCCNPLFRSFPWVTTASAIPWKVFWRGAINKSIPTTRSQSYQWGSHFRE